MGCGNNSLIIGKKSNCNSSGGGTGDCGTGSGSCGVAGLSPRRERGRVVEELKDYVLLMLGSPVLEIELDQQQLDLAVNNTLKILEYYAPREYFRYYTFMTTSNKSVYEMPPDVGYIREVSYRSMADFGFTANDLGGGIPLDYFYPGGVYSGSSEGMLNPLIPQFSQMSTWINYQMYSRMFSRTSSQLGSYEFIGGYRAIKLYPIPRSTVPVIVHYIRRCEDFGEALLMAQEGALIHAKLMLGMIRKKYSGALGPGGGFTLDGSEMYASAVEEMKIWRERLSTEWGDLPGITLA